MASPVAAAAPAVPAATSPSSFFVNKAHLFTSFTMSGVISPAALHNDTTLAGIGYQAHHANE
jgi:hypothetical protein